MRYTFNNPLVAATAVREADKDFEDHILEASTAPSIIRTAIRNEHNPSVQSWKRLPLKMIISEMASRDSNTVQMEPTHQSVHSHADNITLCNAPTKKRCPGRCSPKKSLADATDDPVCHSEQMLFSEVLKGPGNEVAWSDYQTVFPETSHSSKSDERSRCADVKNVFPHGYFSMPCDKSRFHFLYGSEVLNKTVQSGALDGPQTHKTQWGQWLNNDDEIPYGEKYKDGKKLCYQSQSSSMSKYSNDTGYEYNTEDSNNNISLKQYPLDYSPTNIESPTFMKHVDESTNTIDILSSPSSSTYSTVNAHSDGSTEDEYEQATYKRKRDTEYTSENRFLHPLVKFKSKHQEAGNVMTGLSHAIKSRNVSNWKSDCEYSVNDLQCITPSTDHQYSTENLSSMCGGWHSDSLHDVLASSVDPICWYQVKYTRRTRSIRISNKPSGLPESKSSNKIPTDLQQTYCSTPSEWHSPSQNHELNIVPYLSSPEDDSHDKPITEHLVFTHV